MKRVVAFASVVFGLVAAAREPQVYKLLIDVYPSGGAACADVATKLAQDFKRLSGITLASGRHTKAYPGACDIELRYTAMTRLHPVSTIEFSVGVPSSYQGSYATITDCESDLAAQKELYVRETGLEPLLAYCYYESKEKRNAAVLRIDGFGKPVRGPVVQNRDLFGDPVGDLDQQQTAIRRYAETKIEKLSSAVLRTYVLEHSIRTVYYADRMLPVRIERIGEYRTAASCLRAKALADEKLASMAVAPPLLCLSRRLLGGFSLEAYQVKIGAYLDLVPYPTAYASRAECEADADKAAQEVSASVGAPALASVCRDRGNGASATVLVRRN